MGPELLTPQEVAQSGRAIEAVQERDGAIPWTVGGHTDVWNHVEAAMALLVAGRHDAADRAWEWVRRTQRHDGSWPLKTVGGVVEDASGETNMAAYVAVGVWHHWLVRRDERFVAADVADGPGRARLRLRPAAALRWHRVVAGVVGGRPGAGQLRRRSSPARRASTTRCVPGLTLAELLDDPQPEWELAAGRLGHALREHRDRFLDKSTFSMDWYYPVLGGARPRRRRARAASRAAGHDFVVPGLGVRCVDTNPWVTGAETCELALALDALGDRERAVRLFVDMQHLRDDDGGYWTGYVYPDDVHWPAEHTTYTTAAVLLAHDALSGQTPGGDLVRGAGLVADPEPLALECGCASADALAGRA